MAYEKSYSRNILEIIKKTFVSLYNHLGYTALISLIWFFVMVPFGSVLYNAIKLHLEQRDNPLGLFLVLFVFLVPYSALLLGPVNCALFYLAGQIEDDMGELKDLWVGFRKHYVLAAKVYAVFAAIFLFTLVDFIISVFVIPSLFLKLIAIILFYIILFQLLLSVYLPGFIVLQDNTVKKVFKKSILLTLDNTPFTLLVGAIMLILGVLPMILPIALPLLVFAYGGFLQFFGIRVFLGLLAKYPEKQEENVSG